MVRRSCSFHSVTPSQRDRERGVQLSWLTVSWLTLMAHFLIRLLDMPILKIKWQQQITKKTFLVVYYNGSQLLHKILMTTCLISQNDFSFSLYSSSVLWCQTPHCVWFSCSMLYWCQFVRFCAFYQLFYQLCYFSLWRHACERLYVYFHSDDSHTDTITQTQFLVPWTLKV